jgi:galactokinase
MDSGPHREDFVRSFGGPPQALVRAPGRVNLIGDHTDYNDGFALPVATQCATWIGASLREGDRIRAVAADLGETREWDVEGAPPESAQGWAVYIGGVATLLRRMGARLRGFDLHVTSDLPIGAGLSSSAALTVGTAKALAGLAGETLTAIDLIDLARAAEQEFAGVPCGILDQTAILLCKAGHALRLDCRSRNVEQVAIPDGGYEFLLIDTRLPRTLASGAYARRVEECASAVQYFRRLRSEVRALRDVDVATVRRHASELDPLPFARALHVVTENERVQDFVAALAAGDWAAAGELMNASHASLRDQYEVSTPDLERAVSAIRSVPEVRGARVTGAGFGGCVVALARRGAREKVEAALRAAYDRPPARVSVVYELIASDGATLVTE